MVKLKLNRILILKEYSFFVFNLKIRYANKKMGAMSVKEKNATNSEKRRPEAITIMGWYKGLISNIYLKNMNLY